MWGLGDAGRLSRLHALEGIADEHGEAIKRLEHKDIEIAAALNKLSAALDTFVSDSAAGRRVLERMLGGIALHRGWLAVVAVASSSPAWFPYVKPMLNRLIGLAP